ncbi:MAG: hypothetical protein HYZ28_15390 [Myxococcales bacterium]|nr:hypothetical protein [Myxococcales bacterium]
MARRSNGNGSSGKDLLLTLIEDVRDLKKHAEASTKTLGKVLGTLDALVDTLGRIEA